MSLIIATGSNQGHPLENLKDALNDVNDLRNDPFIKEIESKYKA